MALVLLVAGLGVAGWFIVEQNQRMLSMQADLKEATETIDFLQNRVRATDENLSASGADVSDALKFWETETRKLWDVANKRNKNWIETNQRTIKSHTTDIAQIRAALKKETESLANFSKQVADSSRAMGDLKGSMDQLIRQQRDIRDQLNTLTRELKSLKGSVEERIANNEEAIASMDQFRRYVNGRLEDITEKIGSGATP